MESHAYKRFCDGDNEALKEIIVEYKNGLTMYLNSYVHSLDIADELCCETFVKLAYKKPRFNEKSSFKTFLYGIGRNVALMYLRRIKNYAAEPLDSIENMPDNCEPEKDFFAKEQNKQLYLAMSKLKREYSEVLWLTYFEELSGSEIASVMKKSLSAVKVLLHRARLALKSELEKEGFEYENY